MTSQQIEKLKSLIQTSSILSASEKSEWLALLSLMNDKQLGELEQILESSKQPPSNFPKAASDIVASKQYVPISNLGAKPAPMVSLKPNEEKTQGKQLPKLSHILNLPKNFTQPGTAGPKSVPSAQKIQPPVNIGAPMAQKQDPRFLGKLKSILNEKELVSGKPGYPLELGDGKESVSSQSLSKPAAAQSVRSIPGIKIPPQELQKPTPTPPLIPKPKTSLPIALQFAKGFEPTSKNAVTSAAQNNLQKSAPAPSTLKTMHTGPGFNAGINFPEISEKAASETLADIKEHLVEPTGVKHPGPLPVSKPVLSKELNLESLNDVALFDSKTLETADLETLVKKIRALNSKFGYFEVVFNLEKSPVFKNYVATGLKALSESVDFDQLAAGTAAGEFLNRGQFEKFTDLLTKIQTA